MNNIIKRVWNQNRMVNIEDLTGAAFQAESGGHTFQVAGIDDTGAAVELSGTVAAVFRRPDNADIALTGSASDGVVSVTLTDDCYAVAGRFGLTIFVTSNSQKVAVYACVGTVVSTSGGAVAGSTPQDVVDLINAINAAVQSIPADYSDLMAAVAPTYSNTALYAKGAYAWYNGNLYRCTTAITTAESWTAAHWTQVDMADELQDFKDGLDAIYTGGNNLFDPETAVEKHSLSSTNGKSSANNSYWHTDYIDCNGLDVVLLPANTRILRYCWYSAKNEDSFVSFATATGYVTKPSTARYLRVVFYNTYTEFANRYTIRIIGYGKNPAFETHSILNYQKSSVRDEQYFFVDRGDYTDSFDITMLAGDQCNKNMIVTFRGYYTGATAPTIQFLYPARYDTTGVYFTSQVFTMGNTSFLDTQEWRLPAFPIQALCMRATITIPSGTTLHIEHLYNAYDNTINRDVGFYKLESHLGTMCIYPGNTMLAFNSAAKLGYPSCVAVPKRTSDGVWVCFHDDSNVGTSLRNPDGTNLSSTDAAKSISDFTYSELLAFSAGAKKSMFYAGEKVPTLEAFFQLCQRTGMGPVLSTHPNPTTSEWAEIKALAKKYNVVDKLTIKGGSVVSLLTPAHDAFGDEIAAYIIDTGDSTRDVVTELNALGWQLNHAKLGVEYSDSIITQEKVTATIAAGYIAACFIQYGTAARYKELLDMGVTEITDDNNCSYGLNW